MLQKELDAVHAEIQESKNQTFLNGQAVYWVNFNEMQMSIDVIHQQILSCHEPITLSKQSSREKGQDHP